MDNLKLKTSFSYIAPYKHTDLDAQMNQFYDKIKNETGLNKEALLKLA